MFLFREGEPLLRSVYSPREGRLLQHKVTVSSQPGEQSKEYKDLFTLFSITFRVLKCRFWAFPWGPGGFKKLREAYRIHFHQSWYL